MLLSHTTFLSHTHTHSWWLLSTTMAVCAWLVESFPSHVRLTSVSIGYNIALSCFGGCSGFLATVITDRVGLQAPGYIMSVVSLFAIFGLYLQPTPKDGAKALQVMPDLTDLTDLALTVESGMGERAALLQNRSLWS